jgi:hypothetical protein
VRRRLRRLRRLYRKGGVIGGAITFIGAILWLIDQLGRWDTAKTLMASIQLPDVPSTEQMVTTIVAVILDGRVMMAVGFTLVLWVLARQEAEPDTEAEETNQPKDGFEVQVYGGKTVTLSCKNKREHFILGVRARIIHCTEGINYAAPYEYRVRPLGTGEALSHFQVASIDGESVSIHGEFNNIIDRWSVAFRPKFECQVLFTFVAVEGLHSRQIDERTVTITTTGSAHSHTPNRRLVAEITPVSSSG